MCNKKLATLLLIILLCLNSVLPVFAEDKSVCKYCDFSQMYVGEDKFEKFNRKMFRLNSNLNKFIAKPVHILWASILPQYGLDRIKSVYDNIEYPKRLASCLIQKDFKGAKNETKRFITNTTLGLGGLYDPAKSLLKINPVSENMDQALCRCNVKSGPYIVMPVLSSSCPRSLFGRLIEAALDPSAYLGTPIAALAKLGLVINKTSYMQPLIQMIESTYADPYDIAKKMYGIESYIKTEDLDRKNLLSTEAKILNNGNEIIANVQNIDELKKISEDIEQIKIEEGINTNNDIDTDGITTGLAANIVPDIIIHNYNPQNPVVDSMRTALFDTKDIDKSMWNVMSIWNHSFFKRIKTDSIKFAEDTDEYNFKYILQKDRTSPVAIIYPSIGEGITSHHSVVFAKILYDAGYSVIIQGSHFQWEFAKSMPKGYCPGLPAKDSEYLRLVTGKIVDKLQTKYNCQFKSKILVGTSFGAMATLFVADKESKENTLGISKYIAMSPPVELMYALKEADKNGEEFDKSSPDAKHQAAITAAKVLQLYNEKEQKDFKFTEFPFSESEGKLIVSFILRQKLSDLIYTIEKSNYDKNNKNDLYNNINNISYKDYAEKYLLKDIGGTINDIDYDTSLYSISAYLKNNDNYKIYHSLDDFFTNKSQIETIKNYSPQNVICLNNGSHLGYLYREEFLNSLKENIKLN